MAGLRPNRRRATRLRTTSAKSSALTISTLNRAVSRSRRWSASTQCRRCADRGRGSPLDGDRRLLPGHRGAVAGQDDDRGADVGPVVQGGDLWQGEVDGAAAAVGGALGAGAVAAGLPRGVVQA